MQHPVVGIDKYNRSAGFIGIEESVVASAGDRS